jgi:hypothetical protein
MRKLLFSSTLLVVACFASRSQGILPYVTNSTGGSYAIPDSYIKYIDWSVGELTLINTVATADSSVIIYQGVLQPCTEKPGNTPLSRDFQPGDYKIFPNPTLGNFEIDFFLRANGTLVLELTNAIGETIETRRFRYYGCCRIEHYDITKQPAGMYLVAVTFIPDPVGTVNEIPVMRRSGLKIVKLK